MSFKSGKEPLLKCILPFVISSEFRMRQYRDDDHRPETPHFNNRQIRVGSVSNQG